MIDAPSSTGGVYFIGIGGIGMSAIARYFRSKGIKVSGYDKTPTPLTRQLEQSGIDIHYQPDVNVIPKDADLIVYTPAVLQDHIELNYYLDHHYPVVKRSDVLEAITANGYNICVAGTHGKTTISTMIAHILRHSGYGCNAFLGGISVNYDTNFWDSENNTYVVEADEYDRSFLKLNPDIAIISAMDADHLDIYGDEKNMQDAFVAFGNKIKGDGLLITKFGLPRLSEIHINNQVQYSLQNSSAGIYATNIVMHNGTYRFDMVLPDKTIDGLQLNIGGMHNVENAVAAITVADYLKIDPYEIAAAVADFKGVKRRFEYILPPQKQQSGGYIYPVLIDDYAHHPEELKALLKSARSLFPQRKITVIFQPHLYSRTKDLQNDFASSLNIADTIILLPVYPAREQPIPGVSSQLIYDKIEKDDKKIMTKDEVLQWAKEYITHINKEFGEVIITAGAGDIDSIVQPLKQILQQA